MAKEVRKLYYGLVNRTNPDLEVIKKFELESDFTDPVKWLSEAHGKAAALAVRDITEGETPLKEGETVYYTLIIRESDHEGNLYIRGEAPFDVTRGLNKGPYSVD